MNSQPHFGTIISGVSDNGNHGLFEFVYVDKNALQDTETSVLVIFGQVE